ncbi:hypothetical protein THASP1DRAFT_11660, partial [Thamnocephalis sphaerospora]
MINRIRCWRQDAMQQHLYESAAFWGDKAMSMSGDPNDVFWLAHIYFRTGQYSRVEQLLSREHLLDTSVVCRFLAAQCLIKLEKWSEALEILGEENPWANNKSAADGKRNAEEGIRLEASMCYLRGEVYLAQNNVERAKACYKEALETDVKCYDALHKLITHQMMTVKEEQEFLQSLDLNSQLREEDAQFVEALYALKRRKDGDCGNLGALQERLEHEYALRNNVDVEMSLADLAFAQCQYRKGLGITTKLLHVEPHHPNVLSTHIACLYELGEKQQLFLLAHEMVERFPDRACSWFGVGCYYFLVGDNARARRYFSKSSTIDGNYGPAWVAFGHTFAEEGGHDQAMAAYSSAARICQGSHLPQLFIGMQYLGQGNTSLAEDYFQLASELCPDDALVTHELGALNYKLGEYEKAIDHFKRALALLTERDCNDRLMEESAWRSMGHSYRRLGQFEQALECFHRFQARCPNQPEAYVALGYTTHAMGDTDGAIKYYHQALSFNPTDPMTVELLDLAM